ARPEVQVRLHHENLRPDALEADDAPAAFLSAVEADVVRPQTGGQAGRKQEVGVEAWDLDQQAAGPLVPVEREEAVQFLETVRALVDRRGARGRALSAAAAALRLRRGRGTREHDCENDRCSEHME